MMRSDKKRFRRLAEDVANVSDENKALRDENLRMKESLWGIMSEITDDKHEDNDGDYDAALATIMTIAGLATKGLA